MHLTQVRRRNKGISHRIRRKSVRRAMLPNPQLENRYAAGMRAIFQDMHAEFMKYLEPRLKDVARADASDRELKIREFQELQRSMAKTAYETGNWTEYYKMNERFAAYVKTLKPDVDTKTSYKGPKDGRFGYAVYNPHNNEWTVFRYKTEAARDKQIGNVGSAVSKKVDLHSGITTELSAPAAPRLPAMPQPMVPFGRHGVELQTILAKLTLGTRQRVINLFNKTTGKLDIDNAKVIADLIGVDVRRLGISHIVDQFRESTIRLVEDAGRSYAKQVREVFEAPGAHNLRVEELRDQLEKCADVSTSRADLIARDQVLKMNGQITASRQQRAGITQYEWSTSQDERVRDTHAALEGTIQDWNNPPVVDEKTGRTAHPGGDYQCRCVAVAIIPGLDT